MYIRYDRYTVSSYCLDIADDYQQGKCRLQQGSFATGGGGADMERPSLDDSFFAYFVAIRILDDKSEKGTTVVHDDIQPTRIVRYGSYAPVVSEFLHNSTDVTIAFCIVEVTKMDDEGKKGATIGTLMFSRNALEDMVNTHQPIVSELIHGVICI